MSHQTYLDKPITAAMLAIGDELLSGRTKDKNIGYLADQLTTCGIDLKEVRIVPDDADAIIAAVNALRPLYDYIFTSGGIGPTHDDITAEAISEAFGKACIFNKEADDILSDYYKSRAVEYTHSRKMMTRTPEGAKLILNPISAAPGFIIENTYVMAGVPSIFQAMLLQVIPTLRTGIPYFSLAIPCPLGEGTIGSALAEIQKNNTDVIIGSYPHFEGTGFSLEIVIRSKNENAIKKAQYEIVTMIHELSQH